MAPFCLQWLSVLAPGDPIIVNINKYILKIPRWTDWTVRLKVVYQCVPVCHGQQIGFVCFMGCLFLHNLFLIHVFAFWHWWQNENMSVMMDIRSRLRKSFAGGPIIQYYRRSLSAPVTPYCCPGPRPNCVKVWVLSPAESGEVISNLDPVSCSLSHRIML